MSGLRRRRRDRTTPPVPLWLAGFVSASLLFGVARPSPGAEATAGADEPSTGTAQPLQAALRAAVRFSDPGGRALERIPRETTFRIELEIENLIGPEPPAGLFVNGWLRPRSLRNLPCTEAARSYLATGRTPIGSVDLNGPIIGVLATDGAFTIVDPELDLASANLLGATTFDERIGDLVSDPEQARFLVALPDSGRVQAIDVFGATRETVADGLERPATLVADGNGGFWVLERGNGRVSRIDPLGKIDWRRELGADDLREGAAGHGLLVLSGNELLLLARDTGAQIAGFTVASDTPDTSGGKTFDSTSRTLTDAIPLGTDSGSFGIAVATGGRLQIHYLDDVDAPLEIALAEPATALAADAEGRFVFAYSPGGGATSIVDIAHSRLAQVIGSVPNVADIGFAGRAAFLMLADQSLVGVVDLASIRHGEHAEVREVALGTADDVRRDVSALMTPLPPSNTMLAVHADSYTGFAIEDSSTMGDSPPMTAIRLRGGVPRRVESMDRSFRENVRGLFVANARLPEAGQFELVVTTGIGNVSACFPVPTDSDAVTSVQAPGTLAMRGGSGASGARHLQLLDAEGRPAPDIRAEVTFSALESHWRRRVALTTDAEGMSDEAYELPPLGTIVVTVQSRDDNQFQPLLLEIGP